MRLSRFLVGAALICGVAFPGKSFGQAWVQPTGSYYFKVSGVYLSTRSEFNFRGDKQDIFEEDETRSEASFRDVSVNAYLEYGVSENFTLVASLPFKVLTAKETRTANLGFPSLRAERTNGGLGDLMVAVRTPLVKQPFALSLQGGVKIPTGYEDQPDNDGPPIGTGNLDVEGHVALGKSLYPLPVYVTVGGGYRVRMGDLNDEIVYNAEAGATLGPLFVKLRFDGLQNVEDPPDIAGATVVTPLPGGGGAVNQVIVGDQDIFKLSPSVAYQTGPGFAISADLFHTLSGKNTVTGTTYSIGLVFSR